MNEDGANAAGLAASLNRLVGGSSRQRKLLGFVVYLNGNPQTLKRLAAQQRIENIGLAYLEKGRDFRDKRQSIFDLYKINPAARNTVIVYKNWKVVANFVNLDASDFGRVEAVVRKIVPGLKSASGTRTTDVSDAERRAMAAIRELGAKVGAEDGRAVELSLQGARIIDASLEPVKHLTYLRQLTIEDCAITDAGLAHLQGLTHLARLEFRGDQQITGAGLERLAGLSSLEWLDLSGTGVIGTGLRHLYRLPRLKSLQLGGSGITDAVLRELKGLTQVNYLGLRNTAITNAGMAYLKGLPNLEQLDFWSNDQVSDAGLVVLGGLTNLRGLELGDHHGITDAGLAHLNGLIRLEELTIVSDVITDAGLAHLTGLTGLKSLHWRRSPRITEEGIRKLKQALPGLQ